MQCPYCSNSSSSVIDTRILENTRNRRRVCDKCSRKFSTLETITKLDLKVIKKKLDGQGARVKEDFSIEKIKKSVLAATGKKNESPQVQKIIHSSINRVLSRKGNEIKSKVIGDIVLKEIGKVSPSSYLRFACEYMGLESLEEVKELISKFKKN